MSVLQCQDYRHIQHSEDAQGTTPCLSAFALGLVVEDVCVWEDLYPALLSVNAAERFQGWLSSINNGTPAKQDISNPMG